MRKLSIRKLLICPRLGITGGESYTISFHPSAPTSPFPILTGMEASGTSAGGHSGAGLLAPDASGARSPAGADESQSQTPRNPETQQVGGFGTLPARPVAESGAVLREPATRPTSSSNWHRSGELRYARWLRRLHCGSSGDHRPLPPALTARRLVLLQPLVQHPAEPVSEMP